MPPRKAAAKKVTKKAAPVDQPTEEEQPVQDQPQASTSAEAAPALEDNDDDEAEAEGTAPAAEAEEEEATVTGSAMDDRMAKMKALRQRMSESAKANRRDLITETNTARDNARNLAKLERKRKQAEAMGEKQEARETGEDLERKRAWEYTIEDNEKWDKKQARKGRRGDFSFTDYDDIARRKYKKDMDIFKPDHAAYNKQRDAASSAVALVASSSGSNPDAAALAAAQDLYRDANSFVYADHKPSEDAIDRVIGKINLDLDKRQKRSRERKNEDEGDITYINEKNKHFNKKLNRYYDAVTQDTRDAFERGTAL